MPVKQYFNPRTPHGVRLRACRLLIGSTDISIHAPHTGCDTLTAPYVARLRLFQSTHPTRGATRQNVRRGLGIKISIHAPHTGCDTVLANVFQEPLISIHAPHTGCDASLPPCSDRSPGFQSTHPTRGATAKTRKLMQKTSSQSITMHLM